MKVLCHCLIKQSIRIAQKAIIPGNIETLIKGFDTPQLCGCFSYLWGISVTTISLNSSQSPLFRFGIILYLFNNQSLILKITDGVATVRIRWALAPYLHVR